MPTMQRTALSDGLEVWSIQRPEALVLDHHVRGYLQHGIAVRAGDVVLDVGANIGIFGVRAVRAFPDVKVFAFEPIPEIFAVLAANAKEHGEGRLVPLNVGVSSAPGEARFTYYPRSPALSTSDPGVWDEQPGEFTEAVIGQTRAAAAVVWYARLVPSFLAGFVARHLRGASREVQAKLVTLSEVIDRHAIERVDLLKIDCEGAELAALEGVRADHWPRVRRVVVEVHDRDGRLDAVLALLRRNGAWNIVTEKEEGFEKTRLINVYATRAASA
jgi:nonribosomal peptide synthetase DhbF